MMYINIHRIISHHSLKKKSFKNVRNLILTKIWSHLLDFITSQEHSEDQLDQVLQTYQAYQETQSETETPIDK